MGTLSHADVDLVRVVAAELLRVLDDGVHDRPGAGEDPRAEFLHRDDLHRSQDLALVGTPRNLYFSVLSRGLSPKFNSDGWQKASVTTSACASHPSTAYERF